MYMCILYRQLNPMHCLESIVWFFKINKFSEKSKMISEERDSPTTCFSFCLICFKCKLDHCNWHFEPGAWHLIYSIPINCHKIEKIQNLSLRVTFFMQYLQHTGNRGNNARIRGNNAANKGNSTSYDDEGKWP